MADSSSPFSGDPAATSEEDAKVRAAIAAIQDEDRRLARHFDDPDSEPMTAAELRALASRRREMADHLRVALGHAEEMYGIIERTATRWGGGGHRAEALEQAASQPDVLRTLIESLEAVAAFAAERADGIEGKA